MMLPLPKVQKLKEENVSISYINQGADWMEKLLPESIQKQMKRSPKKTEKQKPVQPQYSDEEREKLEKMIEAIEEVDVDEN